MESVETINKRLEDHYSGYSEGKPYWRVVWSEDQMETRFGHWTDRTVEGLFIREVDEYRTVPKYRQYIHQKYILEKLVEVPPDEELVTKLSYEPVFVFQDKDEFPLPPKWEVCQFVIETLLASQGMSNYAKYTDPDIDPDNRRKELAAMKEQLFGNETSTGDALAHGQAIIVPSNYIGEK